MCSLHRFATSLFHFQWSGPPDWLLKNPLTSLRRGRRSVRAIVFVATKRGCQQLERSLRGWEIDSKEAAIGGDMSVSSQEGIYINYLNWCKLCLLHTNHEKISTSWDSWVVPRGTPKSAHPLFFISTTSTHRPCPTHHWCDPWRSQSTRPRSSVATVPFGIHTGAPCQPEMVMIGFQPWIIPCG